MNETDESINSSAFPGRVIVRELDARGWSQRDLAAIMGRPYQMINQIIRGNKRITPETAREMAQAFGTPPEFWMNLETNYRLQLAKRDEKEKAIALRSKLYSASSVVRMIHDGKIQPAENISELQMQVQKYIQN